MNDPVCAVCGETRVGELLMYNYGVCLCRRCNEIAAHTFIKTHVAAGRLQGFRGRAKVSEAAQMYADLSIENNRLRSRLKDLANGYDRYKTGVLVSNWIAMMAGVLIGGTMTFLIYK